MPGIDEDLKSAINMAKNAKKENAHYFALVSKGGSEGALVVAKRKVPNKDIQDAKAKCGGSAIVTGRVFKEDGNIVFESAKQPPSTATKLIKKLIKDDAGLTLPILARKSEKPEEEDEKDEGEPEEFDTTDNEDIAKAGLATKGDDKGAIAAFMERQKKLLQEAVDLSPAVQKEVKLGISQANMFGRKNDYGQANAMLDQVEKIIQDAAASEAADAEVNNAVGQFKDVAKETDRQIKLAQSMKHPDAEKWVKQLAEARNIAKNPADIEKAWEILREVSNASEDAIYYVDVDEEGPELTEEAAAGLKKLFEERLADWGEDIKKALAMKPENAGEIKAEFDKTNNFAKDEDYRKALTSLRRAVSDSWNVINAAAKKEKEAKEKEPKEERPSNIKAVSKKMNELLPAFKTVLKEKNPAAKDLNALFAKIKTAIDAKEVDESWDLVKEFERILKAVSGEVPKASPLPNKDKKDDTQEEEGEEIPEAPPLPKSNKTAATKRFNAAKDALKTAIANKPPELAQIQKLFAEIQTALGKKELEDPDKLDALLDEYEALLKSASNPMPKTGPAKGAFVLMQQSRLVWEKTKTAVLDKMKNMEATILKKIADHNNNEDEDYEIDLTEAANKVKKLYSFTDKLNADLMDKMDEALNLAGEKREEGNKAAVALINKFKSDLDADPDLAKADKSVFSTGDLKKTIFTTLDGLVGRLSK